MPFAVFYHFRQLRIMTCFFWSRQASDKTKANAFSAWRSRAQHVRRLLAKCRARWLNQSMSRAFYAWAAKLAGTRRHRGHINYGILVMAYMVIAY